MRGIGVVLFIVFGLITGAIIAKRQKAEEHLQESEKRFRSIIKSSPLGMYMWQLEPDGRLILIHANPAADQILGVDNSQFIGRQIEDAFPPLAKTDLPRIYKQVAAEGISWNTEEFPYDHEGIRGIFEVHAVQTAPGKMVAIFSDVTERKEIQQEVSQLAKFPSENPNPVLRAARNGTVLYANRAAHPVLDEWNCRQGQKLPDQQQNLATDSLKTGRSTQAEIVCNGQDFLLTFAPVVEVDYVNIYGLDVTERRRAERELRAREADQALILRSVPMVLYSTEASGDFGTTWTSGRVQEITGIGACCTMILEPNLWIR